MNDDFVLFGVEPDVDTVNTSLLWIVEMTATTIHSAFTARGMSRPPLGVLVDWTAVMRSLAAPH